MVPTLQWGFVRWNFSFDMAFPIGCEGGEYDGARGAAQEDGAWLRMERVKGIEPSS